jgi:polyphosphate kinase 2 (PPK2 family)
MGFCSEADRDRFLELCPTFEKWLIGSGVILIKIWLEVGQGEQEKRFNARIQDPLRQWKLSPMDLESYRQWYQYSKARDEMLRRTDTKDAPWYIVRSDDKKRARLNCIGHILSLFPFKKPPRTNVELPRRERKGAYDDAASLEGRHFVPEIY